MKYREKDEQTLKKKVRNYNAKIIRLAKKGYDVELLPQKKSIKQERENAKLGNRKDFNKSLKEIERFTKKGSEELKKSSRGLRLPKYKIAEIRSKLYQVNKDRKIQQEKYKNIELTDRNKTGVKGMINDRSLNVNKLEKRKFKFKNMSHKDFEFFERSLNKEINTKLDAKNKLYRKNYYKAMKKCFTDRQYEKLKKVIDKIPTDTLVEKYYTDVNMDIDFYYDETEQKVKYKEMLKAWSEVQKEVEQQNGNLEE